MHTIDSGFPDDLIGKGDFGPVHEIELGFFLDGADLSFPAGIDSCFFASTQIYSLVFLRLGEKSRKGRAEIDGPSRRKPVIDWDHSDPGIYRGTLSNSVPV